MSRIVRIAPVVEVVRRGAVVRILRAAVLVSALALATTPAEAQEKAATPIPWDQAKVSSLARQLADSSARIQSLVSKHKTGSTLGSGQANAYLRLKDNLRIARNTSKSLAKRLTDGASREETAPTFRRLMVLVRDARENGRKMFLEKPTLDEVAKANEILDQLLPYYGESPDDGERPDGGGAARAPAAK